MQNKTDGLLLCVSIAGFFLLSVSFMLMPIDQLGFLPGILFWSGLIIGTALQIILEVRRRSLFSKYNIKRKTMQKPRNGLLSFACNRIATIADIALLVSLVASVPAFLLTHARGYVCYVCLALLVFSFSMHCILNGRIYFYITNQTNIRQMLEQKTADSTKKGEGKK